MKIRIKKFIALIMTVAMTVTLVACGANEADDVKEVNNLVSYITRGQWVELLAQGFGLDNFTGESPYYTDVNSDDEIYTYVQACYEWNILSTGTDTFKPDDVATLGFVITTSVLAAELDYEKYAVNDDLNESIINCANEYGLTNIKYSDSDELNSGVTLVEASTVLNSAISAYMAEEENTANVCEYTYNEGVVDGNEIQVTNLDSDTVNKVTEAEAEKIDVDSIIIMPPTDEAPNGYAVKITSKKQNADGTYNIETVTPELYEIFENIDIDTTVDVSPENFIPEKGVTVIENVNDIDNIDSTLYYDEAQIDDLNSLESNTDETISASGSKKITLKVSIANGQIQVNSALNESLGALSVAYNETLYKDPNYDDFSTLCDKSKTFPKTTLLKTKKYEELINNYNNGSITNEEFKEQIKKFQDENGALKESYTVTPAFKAGYSITGTVELSMKVTAEADIDFHVFSSPHVKLNSYSVKVESDFNSNIGFKGTLKGSVKIGTLSIPIGAGFSIDADVSIFADVNGEIKYTVDIKNTNKIEYSNGSYKKTNEKSCTQSLEIMVSLEMGFKFTAYLSAFGIKLVDVTVSASALLEAKSKLERKGSMSVSTDAIEVKDVITLSSSVKLYLPIVKISVGTEKSLVKDLGLSLTFTIVGKDANKNKNALFNAKEITLINESVDWVIFECTIPLHEDETTAEDTTTSSGEDTTTDDNTNTGYLLTLSEFVVAMDVGGVVTLTATLPEGYSNSDLVWSSSDSSVATVSNGTIKGVSEGSSTITVTTKDGKYKVQCFVTVN